MSITIPNSIVLVLYFGFQNGIGSLFLQKKNQEFSQLKLKLLASELHTKRKNVLNTDCLSLTLKKIFYEYDKKRLLILPEDRFAFFIDPTKN